MELFLDRVELLTTMINDGYGEVAEGTVHTLSSVFISMLGEC